MAGGLSFRRLGPLEVERDGRPVDLGPRRQRALLALLLVDANRVVPAARVVDELWGDDPPATAGHAVQVYVSRLRRRLEPERVLETRRPGYVLHVPDEASDAARFEALAARGRDALGAGRAAEAFERLTEALGLWRGPALADLAGEPFVTVEAARLEAARLAVVEDRLEAAVAAGRQGQVAGELEALVHEHPLRERLWRLLMLALYRAGRQADALRAFQRFRSVLGEELGLEPSPQTRALEGAIARHDPALGAEPAEAAAPEPAREPVPPPVVGDPERRAAVVLDAELVGTAALAAAAEGERDMVLEDGVDLVAAAVDAFGGSVHRRHASGLVAVFGVPEVHEDDGERAVRAGLRVVEELAAYGDEVARGWAVAPVRARVGIAAGALTVRPDGGGYDLEGDPLAGAAGLRAGAGSGTVAVGGGVRAAVEALFEWSGGEAIGLVDDGSRRRDGARPPLVGRDEELAAAAAVLDAVVAGRGGVLLVSGEPGMGKSRLLAELRVRFERAASPGGRPLWLEGRCVSYGGPLMLWPFRELLREWLGASPQHPSLRTRVMLRQRLQALWGDGASEHYPFLAAVLGLPLERGVGERLARLSPASVQASTAESVLALLDRLTADGPVVAAFDDLQWSDATSLDLVARLVGRTEAVPLLVVLSYRPERDHGVWGVRERALRDFPHRSREVVLDALAPDAAAALLAELVGEGTLPAVIAGDVLDVAEGNPFFVEELARTLVDEGAVADEGQGWRFQRDVAVRLPETVEKVLLARIDRLAPGVRRVLTAAAVLGRQFQMAPLEELCGADAAVAAALGALERVDLVCQARRWPRPEYRFKHVLVMEAAYRTLVPERRRELHRRAAHALETLYPDRSAESYSLLARHYDEAGEAARALAYHRLAAETDRRAFALDEVIRQCTAGLAAARQLSRLDVGAATAELRQWRGHARWLVGDKRAGEDLRVAVAEARATGDDGVLTDSLVWLGLYAGLVEGRAEKGRARLEEALAVAEASGDRGREVAARDRLAVQLANELELEAAAAQAASALAVAEAAGDESLAVPALDASKLVAFVLGDVAALRATTATLERALRAVGDLWLLQFCLAEGALVPAAAGDWEGASQRLEESIALARRLGDRADLAYCLLLSAWTLRRHGEYGPALARARDAAGAAARQGNRQWMAWSETELGAVLLDAGDVDGAVGHLRQGVAAAHAAGMRLPLARALGLLAWAERRAGEPSAGATAAEAAGLLGGVRAPAGKAVLSVFDGYAGAARALLAGGDGAGALALVRPLAAATEAAQWPEATAAVALVEAEAALDAGDRSAAVTLAERALALATVAGAAPVQARAHTVLAGAGGPAAADHAAAARALGARLGATLGDDPLNG